MSFEILRFRTQGKDLVVSPHGGMEESSLELVAGFFQRLLVKEGSDLHIGHKRDISGTRFSVLVDEVNTGSMATILMPGHVTPRIVAQVSSLNPKRVVAEQIDDGSVKLVALVRYK